MNIVCIGDSLTFGYGIRKIDSWCSLLDNIPSFNVINKGINGDSSVGILSRFYEDVLTLTPSLCIIMCGSNDILANRSVRSILDNVHLMVEDCKTQGIIPLIMSPPKIYSTLATKLWSNNINYDIINSNLEILSNELSSYCTFQNIKFIDIYNLLPYKKIYFTDGLHISEEGNRYIYMLVKDRIAI